MFDLPIAVWMIPSLFLLIFLGTPVSLSLIIIAVGFATFAIGDMAGLQLFRFIGSVASNYSLAAVPLFIFMGAMLEGSSMSSRLFALMKRWFGRLPGGMSVATIALCTIFAAGTGIVGAVEAMVGLIAIPAMLREGYDKKIISGVICAGGSLGTMIPPSIVVIIYASVSNQSVGALFAAVIYPAALMVGLFLAYVMIYGFLKERSTGQAKEAAHISTSPVEPENGIDTSNVFSLLPPLLLVISVVGSILAGIAAVTEAAAIGAAGAVTLNLLYKDFSWKKLWSSTYKTVTITSMILLIVVGGTLFTSVFRLTGGTSLVASLVADSNLGSFGMILLFLLIVFVLGALLDWISVVLIAVPIFIPFLGPAGIDQIWMGVLIILVLQTSYLTPPMAPSVFYLRGVAPGLFTYKEMYLGVLPFIICQVVVIVAVLLYPPLATALPDLFGLR
ncbi:TRAP transporter large permease subunit [Paraburkholderia aspalathi]|nr:TRAP transporter large permease subunit [Paraburkholderia aspalathi]